MFIANEYIHIKEQEGTEVTEEMVDALDKMLNEYSVPHFFAEPIETKDENVLAVFYDGNDFQTFSLVYLLWCKAVRNIDEQKIWKAMKEVGTKNTKEEETA